MRRRSADLAQILRHLCVEGALNVREDRMREEAAMSADHFRPGDRVLYCDRDQLQWGPWKVSEVNGDKVTVLMEDVVSYAMDASRLRRFDEEKKLI